MNKFQKPGPIQVVEYSNGKSCLIVKAPFVVSGHKRIRTAMLGFIAPGESKYEHGVLKHLTDIPQAHRICFENHSSSQNFECLTDWLRDNIRHEWCVRLLPKQIDGPYEYTVFDLEFSFSQPNEAVLFKLTWHGHQV